MSRTPPVPRDDVSGNRYVMTESARQGSAGLGATLLPDNPDLLRRVIDGAAIGMALLDRHGRTLRFKRTR